MSAAVKLSPAKLDMLQLLLKDPKIKSCIIVDGSYAGEIRIEENGDILLGRTKRGWYNRLFNSYKEVDFYTMASRIAVVITSTLSKSEDLGGLIQEIIDKTLLNDDREQIIDMLFQYVVLFCKDSIYYSRFTKNKASPSEATGRSRIIGTTGINVGGAYLDMPVMLDEIPMNP